MRFTPEFLDRLRSQVVLSQVVGRRVMLKRHGREHTGLCPFHKEKSPSFTVNDDKGFYHCFGCGAHGDAIRFLTDHEGLPYPEAVERLAGEFGLPLPQLTQEQVQVAKRYGTLQDVMEAACLWFEAQLKAPSGKVAQDYLKGRGLTGKTAKHFRMGFSPAGRDALKTHLLAKGFTDAQLVEVGLAIKPDKGQT
ncbi:MAG: DNA primase, partial [Alphaproteobacteria bacterium]|nr:DNA primase [Alphaproteobacteria bacterium]